MAGRRPVKRRNAKVPRRVRVLNGEIVTPVKCYSNRKGAKWNLMGGQIGRDSESINGADGRPIPFQSFGHLEWR